MMRLLIFLGTMAGLTLLPPLATAQSPADAGVSSAAVLPSHGPTYSHLDLTYIRPTEKTKLRNYAFDVFGPYPIVGAAIAAGINQADKTPPDWRQGAEGYGKRFASDFGIAAVSTTTR
jgi:hypothetical protein